MSSHELAELAEAAAALELIEHFDHHVELESTQLHAQGFVGTPDGHGRLVVADRQRQGRGRQGRPWFSPTGGLWCSLVLNAPRPPTSGMVLTLVVGLACVRALRRFEGCDAARMSWPNDILVNDRKIAGILVDSAEHWCVVGIGVDVAIGPADWPPDLQSIATSMAELSTEHAPSRAQVLGALFATFAPIYQLWCDGDDARLHREIAQELSLTGQRVLVTPTIGAPYPAVVTGIGQRGELLVRPDATPPSAKAECTQKLYSGSIRLIDEQANTREPMP